MESLYKDKTLETVVEELIDIYYPLEDVTLKEQNQYLQKHGNKKLISTILSKRLQGELRRYLARPDIYSEQISYLRKKIEEVEKG